MAKITINGVEYDLRFTLWASEQVETEYGSLKDGTAKARFAKHRNIKDVKKMFRILANAGRKAAKEPMDVTGDEIDNCSLGDLNEISKALNAAMEETMHLETVGGGEADDEETDALAAEYDQKNASAGGSGEPGNTTGSR